MVCLEVKINDRRFCVAGVGDEGAVSAFVTWVKFGPETDGADLPVPPGSTILSVSGITDDLRSVHWGDPAQPLSVGDKITIRVVDTERPDDFTPTPILPEDEDE